MVPLKKFMDFDKLRELMIKNQLISRGIKDSRVLKVMRKIPRHKFVPDDVKNLAYNDGPLPIGCGQTISQPYMVAIMTEKLYLEGNEKVLEIGTGSGYQTAILTELAEMVYSAERHRQLANNAKKILDQLGYTNVKIKQIDGTLGWEECAPYQAIIVTAASPDIPESLVQQLDECGKIIIPIGSSFSQMLTLIRKKKNRIIKIDIMECAFVPLIGKQGWSV